MNKHSQYTVDRLETARRARDRSQLLSWAIALVAIFLIVLMVLALVDYRLMFGRVGRFVAAGGLGILIAFGFFRLIELWRRASNIKQVALDIEEERPELGCVVSTASEYLGGERKVTHSYEPELVEALQEQAAKSLLMVETPYYKRIVGAAILLGVSCIAFVLFAFLTPMSFTAIERIVMPWKKVTYTTLKVMPGNVELPVGRDQEIKTAFAGRLPRTAQLQWHSEESREWQTIVLTSTDHSTWSHTFSKMQGRVAYRVAGGDVVSDEFVINTYVPPEVKDLKIRITSPEYTKHQPVEQSAPDISALRGSRLSFNIHASGRISRAQLRFANLPAVPLSAGENNLWSGELQAVKDALYWIELFDSDGRKGGNEKPYHLTVLADEPPHVVITNPGADIRADATNRVPVKILVTDDYAVQDVKLVFHKIGGQEQVIACAKVCTDGDREATATAEIDLAPLQLKDYELVSYHAEARDNNTLDGPGIGKSSVYFIEVTSKEKALSQCNGGGGQKINILEVEKHIIAGTTSIKDESRQADRMLDLATAQREAQKYAEIFQDSFVMSVSPPEARAEFAFAIESMKDAAEALDSQNRGAALKSEEEALAHLYQVARLLPEFESMCKGGNCTKIVLEAIEKMKKEQKKKTVENLPQVLAQARKVAEQQARLNAEYLQPRSHKESPENQPKKDVQNPAQPNPGGVASGDKPAQKPGEGSKPGGQKPGENSQGSAADQLAKAQMKLSEEARALAEKLRELSKQDPRVENRHSENLKLVSGEMAAAAEFASRGGVASAQTHGNTSWNGLNRTVTALQKLLESEFQMKGTDVASEDFPKEFEALISEYYRKLSYEE